MRAFLSDWFCHIFWHKGIPCMWARSEQGGQIQVTGFCMVCQRCGEMLQAHPAAQRIDPPKPDVKDETTAV